MTALSVEEKERFERDGWVGPFTYLTPDEMAVAREEIERQVFGSRGPQPRDRFESRHQDCPRLFDVCSDPRIVERVSSVLGPDVVVWNSVIFYKPTGGSEVPWHQDLDYLLLDPHVNVSAWLALDRASKSNGCLQIIPGSHVQQVPHIHRRQPHQFMAYADPKYVDRSRAVDIELEPGQFVLFHRDVLHHSGPNLSLDRRMAVTLRYTVPGVRVNVEGLFPDAQTYCVRGEDRAGVNRMGVRP